MTPYGAALLTDPKPGWGTRVTEAVLPGSAILVFGNDSVGVEGRVAGLEVRDTLAVLSPGPLTSFGFLFRKALTEPTVAAQVISKQVGGLNIQGCRVSVTAADAQAMERVNTPGSGRMYASRSPIGTFVRSSSSGALDTSAGRWPSNLVLVHGVGCRRAGTMEVRTSGGHYDKPKITVVTYSQDRHTRTKMRQSTVNYGNEDGLETVAAYECEAGCPVGLLDRQSGTLTSGLMVAGQKRVQTLGLGGYHDGFPDEATQAGTYGDAGGASRFFPQFANKSELLSWLRTLILPPGLALFED